MKLGYRSWVFVVPQLRVSVRVRVRVIDYKPGGSTLFPGQEGALLHIVDSCLLDKMQEKFPEHLTHVRDPGGTGDYAILEGVCRGMLGGFINDYSTRKKLLK